KSGRVRQRTMSQAQSELNSAVAKLRASESSTAAAAPAAPEPVVAEPVRAPASAPVAEEEQLEDPLSAYIEEVDEPEPAKTLENPAAYSAEVVNERDGHTAKAPEPLVASPRPAEANIPAAHIIAQRPAPAEKVVEKAAEPAPH